MNIKDLVQAADSGIVRLRTRAGEIVAHRGATRWKIKRFSNDVEKIGHHIRIPEHLSLEPYMDEWKEDSNGYWPPDTPKPETWNGGRRAPGR